MGRLSILLLISVFFSGCSLLTPKIITSYKDTTIYVPSDSVVVKWQTKDSIKIKDSIIFIYRDTIIKSKQGRSNVVYIRSKGKESISAKCDGDSLKAKLKEQSIYKLFYDNCKKTSSPVIKFLKQIPYLAYISLCFICLLLIVIRKK